jgi:hypothetical protein
MMSRTNEAVATGVQMVQSEERGPENLLMLGDAVPE